jgi:hypothetical protein
VIREYLRPTSCRYEESHGTAREHLDKLSPLHVRLPLVNCANLGAVN